MVATILRLRFAILANVLASSGWMVVAYVLGGLAGLWVTLMVCAGLFMVGAVGLATAQAVLTGAGALLLVGWTTVPLAAAGVDTAVDASRLAPFPLTGRQVALGLTAVGVTGVPGLCTCLVGLAAIGAWWRWPWAIPVALVTVPIGVLTAVVASRLVTTAGGRRSGRAADAVGLLLFVGMVLLGPILTGVALVLARITRTGASGLSGVATALGWTPLGAAWAVPGDVAAGDLIAAAAKFAIALATLALLWLVWERRLASASAIGAHARGRGSVRLGVVGLAPTGALGATWARSLRYWLRDPRYLRQLIVSALLPFPLLFASAGTHAPAFGFASVLVALMLGYGVYTDVSYDGTAFAGVVAAGVRGRADRAGRMLAALTPAVPLVCVVAVVALAFAGMPALLPAVLGASLGLLLVAHGVSAVTSAVLIMPVPVSGQSLFARVPGATFVSGLAAFGILIAAGVLGAPAYVPAIVAAATGDAGLAWLSLPIGVGYGILFAVAGVLVGGSVFDRTAPMLLARVRALKGV